jgi:POT family proton-dependent oligopeptide transporter
MIVGVIVYLAGQRLVPVHAPTRGPDHASMPLTPREKTQIGMMLLIWPLIVCFWIAQTQVWNVYNLWVRDHVQLSVAGFQVPVPWLQAFDGLAPVIVMTPFLALWRWQATRGREPGVIAKIGIGCLIFAAGTTWLALAPLVSTNGRAPILWALAFHLLSNIGWLYVAPIALALYGGRSPSGVRGTMLGINYLAVFAASTISGRLGGLYETLSPSAFWMLHSAIVAGGGVLLLALSRPIERVLAEGGPERIDEGRLAAA